MFIIIFCLFWVVSGPLFRESVQRRDPQLDCHAYLLSGGAPET